MDKDETGRFMNRQTWRDWLWLALLGLLVQAFWAWRIQHPTYFDAYYYTVNAQQIAQGEGLTEPVIWQYLDLIPDSDSSAVGECAIATDELDNIEFESLAPENVEERLPDDQQSLFP